MIKEIYKRLISKCVFVFILNKIKIVFRVNIQEFVYR
jgi:hypothetical protein